MSPRPKFRHPAVDVAGCVGAIAIAGAVFWLGVWPVIHAEQEARRLADKMDGAQQQLEDAQDQFRSLRGLIAGTLDRLEDIEVVLNKPDQLAARQADIGRVFGELGLSVEQLSVGEIQRGELLDTIPLRLTGAGDFPDLVRTMHRLRFEFPDMAVTTFQIGAAGRSGKAGEPTITFGLGIDWYVAGNGGLRG